MQGIDCGIVLIAAITQEAEMDGDHLGIADHSRADVSYWDKATGGARVFSINNVRVAPSEGAGARFA